MQHCCPSTCPIKIIKYHLFIGTPILELIVAKKKNVNFQSRRDATPITVNQLASRRARARDQLVRKASQKKQKQPVEENHPPNKGKIVLMNCLQRLPPNAARGDAEKLVNLLMKKVQPLDHGAQAAVNARCIIAVTFLCFGLACETIVSRARRGGERP